MEKREPIVFIPTGETRLPKAGEWAMLNDGQYFQRALVDWPSAHPIFLRLPPGWLDAGVNRAVHVLKERGFHLMGGDVHAVHAAIFPEPEPEPEEYEIEAAKGWLKTNGISISPEYEMKLARHFARARAAAGRKP